MYTQQFSPSYLTSLTMNFPPLKSLLSTVLTLTIVCNATIIAAWHLNLDRGRRHLTQSLLVAFLTPNLTLSVCRSRWAWAVIVVDDMTTLLLFTAFLVHNSLLDHVTSGRLGLQLRQTTLDPIYIWSLFGTYLIADFLLIIML